MCYGKIASMDESTTRLTLGYEECASKVRELVSNINFTEGKIYWVVFDIDGTLLSGDKYKHLYKTPSDVFKYMHKGNFDPIRPIADLYIDLQNNYIPKGLKLGLITGRKVSMESVTKKNLSYIGLKKCNFLCMRPTKSDKGDTVPFKVKCRKEIYDHNGIILANIGDQETDLEGGYAKYAIKLPSTY